MAGDWTKIEHDLRDKPEVIAVANALSVTDRDLIVGKLIRLWQWFDRNTPDGCAAGVTPAFVDSYVALDGFASALETVGWLSIRNGSVLQPNFDRHNSKSAKARALSRVRMQRSRYASSATDAQPEKRREEKRNNPLPLLLQTPEFESAWNDWVNHRKELKKPLKPTMAVAQLKMLADMGCLRAVAMIRHTVTMGWQGLREPENGHVPPAYGPPKPPPIAPDKITPMRPK